MAYPGDPVAALTQVRKISEGEKYNLSTLSLCVHNGTHVDAPLHFIENGNDVENIPLSSLIGRAYVYEHNGDFTKEDATRVINLAKDALLGDGLRLLIKGDATVTQEAAEVLAKEKILLIGTESRSVGPLLAPMGVHLILLRENVVLLEGLNLEYVGEGVYFLFSAPIKVRGAEGAPCRAILVEGI